MKKLKNKIVAITISMLFILSMTASLMLIPSASAITSPSTVATWAYVHVGPDPTGIGQPVTVGFWLSLPPPDASGPYGDRWMDMTVTVTSPDGTNKTLGPFNTDDTGGTSTIFTPTTTGTYTFQAHFPGQTLAGTNLIPSATTAVKQWIGDYFEPSTSSPVTLTVQQTPVGGVTPAPLPTAYWQTPINAMNVNNWYVLGGASLFVTGYSTSSGALYNESGNYNPYTLAPTTSHILWTEPAAFGGALGGSFGGTTTYGNYYSTEQYEHKFEQIVMNGYLYYTQYPGSSTNPTANVCIDLYNGQTVWTDSSTNYGGGSAAQTALTSAGIVTPLYFGQILDIITPNQYGGLAYLWTEGTPAGIVSSGTTYNMFDAMTGKYILSIVNGTGLSQPYFDNGGNLIGTYVNATAGTQHIMGVINDNIGPSPVAVTTPSGGVMLQEWNSTECVMAGAWSAQASGWYWRPPQNGIIPFSDGIEYSWPIATTYQGNPLPATLSIKTDNANTIVMQSLSVGPIDNTLGWGIFAAYSATTGQQLWIENITTLTAYALDVNVVTSYGDGVFLLGLKSTYQILAYSMATGTELWSDTLTGANEAAPDAYDSIGGFSGVVANNTIYAFGFGGDIWSINLMTGKVNWYTNTTAIQGSAGTNSPYNVWPLWTFSTGEVADGMLFVPEGHEYSPPLFLGAQILAVNCTNGNPVWAIDSFDVDSHPITADGIMTDLNAYDNQIYAYGQGPSKTTISAPQLGVTTDTPITLTGTVTDTSAGSTQSAVAGNFPNGLPCVSDASMSQFMESVYMQQPMPTNVKGVPVSIDVLDPNGNYVHLGTAVSDSSGTFSFSVNPSTLSAGSGKYTVIATFAGSGSYYSSSAESAFTVGTAATAIPAATPLTGLASNTTVMYGIIAIAIIIIVIGALILVVVTRKHA